MIKKLTLILFCFTSIFVLSQEEERVEIQGKIIVKEGSDAEGISIYNQSSHKGVITNKEGTFSIYVAEKDSLIISAVQYKSFDVLIEKEALASRKLIINLEEHVNVLEEVVILKKNFTQGWDLSYKTLEYGYEFAPDGQSSIRGNAAEDALNDRTLTNGINIIGLVLFGISKLTENNKKKNKPEPKIVYTEVVQFLKEKYEASFYVETFNISIENVNDFIYFVGETGIKETLLLPENEIVLIEYLFLKSKIYLK